VCLVRENSSDPVDRKKSGPLDSNGNKGEYGKPTGLWAVREETSVVSAETSPITDYLVRVCGMPIVSPATDIMAVGAAPIVRHDRSVYRRFDPSTDPFAGGSRHERLDGDRNLLLVDNRLTVEKTVSGS
jgi:hypothetical protein